MPAKFSVFLPSNFYGSPIIKLAKRARVQATKKIIDPLFGKQEKQKVGKVHTALANGNHAYLTVVKDMIELSIAAGSQDVLNACLTLASLE